MSALICGSYAYDTIMVFPDKFKNHIIPDKIHILNVSFLVPHMRREYGGCAGNIAYNLHLLGGQALPMATVGNDFAPYARWMDNCGITRDHIKVIDDAFTGQAFITTDLDDNQITAFHPGAMSYSHQNTISTAQGVSIGIVSPDGRDGMIQHAAEFAEADIPFIFDPGQGMPMFNGEELMTFVKLASWITLNDYEAQLLQERTGKSAAEIATQVKALIVTLGEKGSMIYTDGKCIEIPIAKPETVLDPTGCGDAYRAGLHFGLMRDFDWETTGRLAALVSALKIAHPGTQNHRFDKPLIESLFKQNFKRNL